MSTLLLFFDAIVSAHTAIDHRKLEGLFHGSRLCCRGFPSWTFFDADRLDPMQRIVRVTRERLLFEQSHQSREQLLWAVFGACYERASGGGVVLVDW